MTTTRRRLTFQAPGALLALAAAAGLLVSLSAPAVLRAQRASSHLSAVRTVRAASTAAHQDYIALPGAERVIASRAALSAR
jgi:hypothetical protein